MFNKTNFMPCSMLGSPSVCYRFDNKTYSPEAWTKKMHAEGYQRAETAAGIVSWSRTVSPFQTLPKAAHYPSPAIFPAGSSRRLNSKLSTRIPENNHHPQPLPPKKSGLHTFQQGQVKALQQSHFTPFQGQGWRLGQASEPVLGREAVRSLWADRYQKTANQLDHLQSPVIPSPEAWTKKMHAEGYQHAETAAGIVSWSRTVSPFQTLPKAAHYPSPAIFPAGSSRRLNSKLSTRIPENNHRPQPLPPKKSGLHTFQQGRVKALQQSHFTPFQGQGRRLGQASEPVLGREAVRSLWANLAEYEWGHINFLDKYRFVAEAGKGI